jgi:hypothetical protein
VTSVGQVEERLPVLAPAEHTEDDEVIGFEAVGDYMFSAGVDADGWVKFRVRIAVGLFRRPVSSRSAERR